MRTVITLLLLFAGNIVLIGQTDNIIPGEIIVQLEPGKEFTTDITRRNTIDIDNPRLISAPLNIYQYKYNPRDSYQQVVEEIQANNAVVHIVPNRKVETRNIPNDKHYEKQNDLRKIDIERAWSVTTGGETALGDRIVVAILDSGYGLDIPDLGANHYLNRDEGPGDLNGDGCPGDCGVDDDMDGLVDEDIRGRLPGHPLYNPSSAGDDDENGYIDDIGGLNMSDFTDVHPEDNHGTAVAGIIGAAGNNLEGVTGVNWDVDMLLISKVVNVAQIIEAYTYIYNQRRLYNESGGTKGAYIVVTNFSSGIDSQFGSDFPQWCNLYDLLGNIGILSVGATTNSSRNVDIEGDLPTTCTSPYLISVTNLDLEDRLDRGGYGSVHIDLGAPGNGTVTTNLTGIDNVGDFSGTSAATPHVAGAVALLHSIPCEAFASYFKENPQNVTELKDYILNSTDAVPDLEGKTVSGGRLNVYNTMVELTDFCPGSMGSDLKINKVYPNPSNLEPIIIEYDSPDGEVNYNFFVFDVLGRLILQKSFSPPLYGAKRYLLDPMEINGGTHFAPGVYYFMLQNETDQVTHKQVITPY